MIDLGSLVSAAGLRMALPLEPLDGVGGRVAPPTYPGKTSPVHVVETYHEDGRDLKRVLVDSVASQANRHELALVAARREGRISFPDLRVDLRGLNTPREDLLVSELPHRLADAIIRDSEIDGAAFANSPLGTSILSAQATDLTPILEASPTTLLYGAWFSQWKMASQLKLQPLSASEIWAYDAVLGHRVGSRIDPLGIVRVDLYEDETGGWTADPEAARKGAKGKPVPSKAKRPSEINHGNIAPTVEDDLGITAARYELRWSLSTAALRRLSFGATGEERIRRNAAAQAYLAAMALAARALADEAGYALRSRCDLLRTGPHTVERLDMGPDGLATETFEISPSVAVGLLGRPQRRREPRDSSSIPCWRVIALSSPASVWQV